MKKVKITVLEAKFYEDLVAQYGAPGLGPCPYHYAGQEFISEGGKKPEGLCGGAWGPFEKYVFALASGADGFWETWIPERKISINACNDGLRPVIFKLEAIDE